LASAIIAVLFSTFPLGYVWSIPGSDRALFVMWLAGLAAYYVASSVKLDQSQSILAAVAFVGLIWFWAAHRTPNDYDLSNYPAFALAFLALIICTQGIRSMPEPVSRFIRFAADYSFSLFLVHLTIVKIILLLPLAAPIKITLAITIANLVAIGFAFAFEQRYRLVATYLKGMLARGAARWA
jgi:peptidoglycan/LPS O-acetylase OafA/YrhL